MNKLHKKELKKEIMFFKSKGFTDKQISKIFKIPMNLYIDLLGKFDKNSK